MISFHFLVAFLLEFAPTGTADFLGENLHAISSTRALPIDYGESQAP